MGHYWTPTLGGQDAVDQMTTRYVLADGDTYGIVNVAVYLEDHEHNDWGLVVQPGSHRSASARGSPTSLRTRKGDAVIFDLRITHRGGFTGSAGRGPSPRNGSHRTLVSIGYGLEHSLHTQAFERGMMMRNLLLSSEECGFSMRNECAMRKAAEDLKARPVGGPPRRGRLRM